MVQEFAFGTELSAYGLAKEEDFNGKIIFLKRESDEAGLLVEKLKKVEMKRQPRKRNYIRLKVTKSN